MSRTLRTCMGLRVAGLFAGIGGIERGLHEAGHHSVFLCDNDTAAQAVLVERFPRIPLVGDVREVVRLPAADIVAAGFPCQDLSQAGRTAGIKGERSGVVREVFRLVADAEPTWLLLENVPFMLQLERGGAMRFLTNELRDLGFNWAYRVVDTRAFGLPQRRQRVILLASRTEDPREVLFHGTEPEPEPADESDVACGFYWTEGLRGLGWAVDAIPTLKSGSAIGIPSPPAIRFPDGSLGTPDLRDAERLQGFDPGWTDPAEAAGHGRARWRLVGNAVSVPVARWVGERLTTPIPYDGRSDAELLQSSRWPTAAWAMKRGNPHSASATAWPVRERYTSLSEFLEFDVAPLSRRAAAGFLERARRPETKLVFPPGLLEAVERHIEAISAEIAA